MDTHIQVCCFKITDRAPTDHSLCLRVPAGRIRVLDQISGWGKTINTHIRLKAPVLQGRHVSGYNSHLRKKLWQRICDLK